MCNLPNVFFALIVIQVFAKKSYHIDTTKHGGVLPMFPKQRILAIRLSEKIEKNPDYAQKIGIEINNKKNQKRRTNYGKAKTN